MNPLVQYWYFHIPNLILAAVMYTLIGRFILSLFAPPDWRNYIWRAFETICRPALRATRAITPEAMPGVLLPVFAALWIMLLRVGWLLALGAFGLLPATA